ncbi:hypothetical protein RUND412_001008 [Rhizina undulata]
MTRPVPAAFSSVSSDSIAAINLSRLLSRLDKKLGVASVLSEGKVNNATSSLERAKIAANLEYARQLLLQRETESKGIKSQSQRQKVLADLGQQKQAIRRFNEKLHIAAQAADEEETDETDDELEPPQDFAEEQPTSAAPMSLPTTLPSEDEQSSGTAQPPTSSTLRNRFAKTSSNLAADERAELFSTSRSEEEKLADTEKVLDMQRKQQDAISEDLLKMARMLKETSLQFGKDLEGEKIYLDQAQEGLDKNLRGMESTGSKMDKLRKNDSISYYWTIIYIASLIVLAFFTLFILFFAPKLRW